MPIELGQAAFWLLIGIGALSGMASLSAFRRWSDPAKLRIAVNHLLAHLMEFQLFADQPLVILRAQYDLVMANVRFLRLLVLPSLLLLLPYAALLVAMEGFFGKAVLPLGRPLVVTLQCTANARRELPEVSLQAPPGIEVETDPVRVPSESQISWRVRPTFASVGYLRVSANGRVLIKKISSTPGLQWLFNPLEFPRNPIWFRYPDATVFHAHWLVWFSAGSLFGFLFSALIPRRHEKSS